MNLAVMASRLARGALRAAAPRLHAAAAAAAAAAALRLPQDAAGSGAERRAGGARGAAVQAGAGAEEESAESRPPLPRFVECDYRVLASRVVHGESASASAGPSSSSSSSSSSTSFGVAALSRAITLIESTRPEHRQKAARLLGEVSALAGASRCATADAAGAGDDGPPATIRVGVSGPPGAGKSSLIERLGMEAVSRGRRVAVLAVDPSSPSSGGSILGDKTRMPLLSSLTSDECFIRASPSGRGTLGGITRSTSDVILLLEAARQRFDFVIVETVGVGQAEVGVTDVVDAMLLVLPPAAGDSLQGIKRGIMEEADIVVVNKHDGVLASPAERAAADVKSALQFIRPRHRNWATPVHLCSAETNKGVDELYASIGEFMSIVEGLDSQRRVQRKRLMWGALQDSLLEALKRDSEVAAAATELEDKVMSGELPARAAADEVVALFLSSRAQIQLL